MALIKTAVVIALSICLSCSDKADPNWMKGGTLQNSTVADWNQATQQNQLATCADLATNLRTKEGKKYESVYELRLDAEILKSCIDKAARKNAMADQKISALATTCSLSAD